MNVKRHLVSLLERAPPVYTAAKFVYRRMWPVEPTVTDLIGGLLQGRAEVFFIQIGSNDGVQGDPIHELIVANDSWCGIFVEPLPFFFERLSNNYGETSRFVFENVAVGPDSPAEPFYHVSERASIELGDKVPDWIDQLGSFDRNHIVKQLDGILEPFIVKSAVECVSYSTLLRRHRVERVDLLHIDTEGYDYEVLTQVDFQQGAPLVILFEHMHLSPETQKDASSLLAHAGYRLLAVDRDTLAVHRNCRVSPLWWGSWMRRYKWVTRVA